MATKIVLPIQLQTTTENTLVVALRAGATVFSVNPFQASQNRLTAFYEQVSAAETVTGIIPGILFNIPTGPELDAINLMAEATQKGIFERVKEGFEHGVSLLALPLSGSPILTDMRALAFSFPNVLTLAKVAAQADVATVNATLQSYDGLFLDRDHLANTLPIEDMPEVEKALIAKFVSVGKPVITAGQLLSSLMLSARPIRGDVTDIAFAVMSGTDALFISDAAARSGSENAVRLLKRIADRAESLREPNLPFNNAVALSITDTTAAEAIMMARQRKIKAIITITSAGYTARQISRYKPAVPIIAVTDSSAVARGLQMSWGVTPVLVSGDNDRQKLIKTAIDFLVANGVFNPGDAVVIVSGIPFGKAKYVNNLIVQEYPK